MKTDLVYDDYKQYEVFIKNKDEFDKVFKIWGDSYFHRFKFENGYGASVIKHYGSYGYEEDLFELAVLKFDGGKCKLCYDTSITDDVIGYLTNDEVLELLEKIKQL